MVNPTLHPDNDELRLAPRWGGLIRQGSRQRLGFPGRGRVGLQRQGSRLRLGSPGWGWVGLRRQGSGAGLGAAAGFGGAGFSGLIPPSQDGPVYMSGDKPRAFHFSSKSAAARLGVSPSPTTSFHG
ncbi:MAG: hypothetical protein AUH74_02405 [Nitrospirae bacterium 13_1_40CM_4_62_6]|nr:MAG: hypothetical protein AUH74_02405 [Nitrospirae bacterium 13_1_40CM_4_62_6]